MTLISKVTTPVVIIGAMFLAAAGLGTISILAVERMQDRQDSQVAAARAQAIAERDAHWEAEIEKSEAAANRRIADQVRTAMAIEADANSRVQAAQQQLIDLEKQNAALPFGDACGLSRDRVRLLPN